MTGNRTKQFYIEKFGEELGTQKYQNLLNQRMARATRRTIDFAATEDAVNEGNAVKCCGCGKIFKRITPTHLRTGCKESMIISEYQLRYPNTEIIAANLKKLASNTQETILAKYGEEIGIQKWQSYCDIQAETNTFEYKAEKYNMTKEEFDGYNKSRSVTLENLVKRHGEEIGLEKWDEYCERQRYTTTHEYFVSEYGEVDGTEKWQNFCYHRNFTNKFQSKIEMAVYQNLKEIIPELEVSIILNDVYYGPYDYGNNDKRRVIEFYGSYWHADPKKYSASEFFIQKNQTAAQIWARDKAKQTYAKNQGYQVLVIWENDWYNDKQTVIDTVKKWWNEN
jgi:G:T-mismatch repair DNA endonuclease (very short patch repair protein)